MKVKSSFFCQNCGYESAKWVGKCPSCGEWNTLIEEIVQKSKGISIVAGKKSKSRPVEMSAINQDSDVRFPTRNKEFNRVLGGGIVPGSLILVGGEPGIGKSTLMLQICESLPEKKILYVTGEESARQIKMRGERLSISTKNCFVLTETLSQNILFEVEELRPDLLIVDSIQTLHSDLVESAPGTISQIRHTAGELLKLAKESGMPIILIGHITKDGSLAGPKVLEHMVDTVLQFEGDPNLVYRILRTTKNRFGSTSEMGIFEMLGSGLREVANPSEILLSNSHNNLSGVAIGASIEGNRPLLIEIQGLVGPATYGTPQRSSTGFDSKRLNMLLAVIEKRCGIRVGAQDVFLNVAGGLKIDDPAIDLAVCMAIVSSLQDSAISSNICFAAEVGLGGEIRSVNRIENRISEAAKLGFKEIFIAKPRKSMPEPSEGIEIRTFTKLREVIGALI
jgi:DNA repair protein RadA/Sms